VSGRNVATRIAAGGRRENERSRLHCLLPTAHCLLIAALLFIASAARASTTLPFIEDDYAKAVARAQAKNLPIFVEAWAPW
jgi:hypothetical protein